MFCFFVFLRGIRVHLHKKGELKCTRNKAAISAATGNSEPLCLLCNKTHKAALFKDTSRTQWVPQPINPLLPHRPPHAASLSHWHQLLKVIRKHAVRNHFPPESFSHRFSEHILKRKKKAISALPVLFHGIYSPSQLPVASHNGLRLLSFLGLVHLSVARSTERADQYADVNKKKSLNKVWTFPRDHRRFSFGCARWLTVRGRCARGAWPKWMWRDTRSLGPTWRTWTPPRTRRDLKGSRWSEVLCQVEGVFHFFIFFLFSLFIVSCTEKAA